MTTVGALLVTLPAPAAAAAQAGTKWSAVAAWRINEPSSARVARDSSRHALGARIGASLDTGLHSGRRTFVRFPQAGSAQEPNPSRLIEARDNRLLDPRSGGYRVAVALRTKSRDANVVQKGQAASSGGFWKLEIARGRAICLFRGGNGPEAAVVSPHRINNGRWHRLVCSRTRTTVALRLDGKVVAVNRKPSGRVSNTLPLTVGGKRYCGSGAVDCDFFRGAIDYVVISRKGR